MSTIVSSQEASGAYETVKDMAAALTVDERLKLIRFVETTLIEIEDYSPSSSDWDSELDAELKRRIADLEGGKSIGVPGEEVHDRIEARLGRR